MKRPISNSRVALPAALLALAACSIVAGLSAATASASSSRATKKIFITAYSVAKSQTFMNHEDDRERGVGNNPFQADTKASKTVTKESGNGPFSGDRLIARNALFTSASLLTGAGSVVFTCDYGFSRSADCTAVIQLNGSLLIGSGPIAWGSKTFTFAITGGTGKYLGVTGELTGTPAPIGTPAAKIAQRVSIKLVS